MAAWLGMIVSHVRKAAKREGRSMKEVYNIPVERLFEGERGIEGLGLTKLNSKEAVVV